MKKLFIALSAFSLGALISTSASAQDCPSIQNSMKKHGLTKKNLQFTEHAEESLYYYFKLPKPVKGKNYLMLETAGGCASDYQEYMSDAEFRKAHKENSKPRIIHDDEG